MQLGLSEHTSEGQFSAYLEAAGCKARHHECNVFEQQHCALQ